MKRTKKFVSILLTLVMVFAMTVTAFAAEGKGSITINKAVVGQTYTIYKILDLESYDIDSNAYSYKAADAWSGFINSNEIKDTYVNVDAQGYVTWVEGVSAADFAKEAQQYAKSNSISNDGKETADNTTVSFTGLDLGYYLVDSSLGTLCSLDTTNPGVTIEEKNAEPGNVKTVEEDSTGEYGVVNDADIGQTVKFQSTITAQAGAENYVFHDTMSAGLDYTGVTGVTLNDKPVDNKDYTVVTSDLEDGCTFEVRFTKEFCDNLKADDTIVISYTATVNGNATIGGDGNPNTSKLSYGEEGKTETTPSSTTTYTWEFKVYKYTMKDNTNTPLAGAEFVLYKTVNGTKQYAQVTNGKITGWTENETQATKLTSNGSGNIEIKGLDSDTYYLQETKAPAGYNLKQDPTKVVIDKDGNVKESPDGDSLVNNTVKVLNQSGTELPSTGGMGTTVFYVLGGILVAGAAVLLVAKRRMSIEK